MASDLRLGQMILQKFAEKGYNLKEGHLNDSNFELQINNPKKI